MRLHSSVLDAMALHPADRRGPYQAAGAFKMLKPEPALAAGDVHEYGGRAVFTNAACTALHGWSLPIWWACCSRPYISRTESLAGPWTYGRWMPVHINLQLYGWCSLPLAAFPLKLYQADRWPAAQWSRTALWAWSVALTAGSLSWHRSLQRKALS
jgi:hypothetical protein